MTIREEELFARVAWAYYNEDMTQAEIAKKMHITRARVNKILQQCRDNGLVQIVISAEQAGCAEAEFALERAYGLVKAIVVPTPSNERFMHDAIGRAAGSYVSDHLRDGQALGLGWGKTLRAGGEGIKQREPGNITIVSLFGGLPRSAETNPYDVASVYARRLKAAECYYIAAPMYVSCENVRETLMTQAMFTDVFERAASVDMALIGAGDLTGKSTNVDLGAITRDEWKSLLDIGAVGEVFGCFLSADGKPVEHHLNRRFMGAGLARLRQIPQKIVACGGLHKIPILKAALEGGYVDVLVTDEVTAQRLVEG